MWWMASWAAAAPTGEVDVALTTPETLPWFSAVSVVPVRGTAKGDDCAGAVRLAIEEAGKVGTVVRAVRSATDLGVLAATPCKQRKAGDAVSASVVELSFLVTTPLEGAGSLPADRWFQVLGLLDALDGEGRPGVELVDGAPYARLGAPTFAEPLDSGRMDQAARLARVWESHVPEFTARWAVALAAAPELAGGALVATVPSEDPADKKSRRTEVFRLAFPTTDAAAYVRGDLTDAELAARARIDVSADPKRPSWTRLTADLEGAELTRTEGVEVSRPSVDVKEEDLEGVEDEE